VGSPQPGIFALGTNSHAYLELDVEPGAEPLDAVVLVASLREPRTTIGGVNLVAGFRPELWAAVAPDAAPAGPHRVRRADPWPGRLRAAGDAARHRRLAHRGVLRRRLRPLPRRPRRNGRAGDARQRDRRLARTTTIGTSPGSSTAPENPSLVDAMTVAVIPDGEPGEGGSIFLLQQWEHDALEWEALPVANQESIIGRRKADSAELDPKPPMSHVARTDQDTFGQIFRRNIGYGSVDRHGTIFSASARISGSSRRCSTAWSAWETGRPTR
jgi:putative iron-dependent peroxidase